MDTLSRNIAEEALRDNGMGDAADRLMAEAAHGGGSSGPSANNRETYLALVKKSRGGDDLPPSPGIVGLGGDDQPPSGGGGGGGGGPGGQGGRGSVAAENAASTGLGPKAGAGGGRGVSGGPRGGGLAFRGLIGGGGGFGGVVFGNSLQRPADFHVQHVMWSPADSDAAGRQFGRFVFVSDRGRVAFGATLPEDIAYAAVALVLKGVDGILPPIDPIAEEAAPLAGVADLDSIPWPLWDTDATRPRIELAEPFALSPALDGLPLGYSAVLADAIPFMTTDNIPARLKNAGASEQELELARKWLDEDWGFYKIIDAPLEVTVQDDGYVNVRSVPPMAQPEELRTTSLLTMAILPDGMKAADPFDTAFHQIVPALARAYPAFADLNAFAEAFALVRWAKIDGAQWGNRPPAPPRGAPLHFVVVTDGTAMLASPTQVMPQLESVLRRADIESGKLVNGAADAIATNTELTVLRRQAIAHAAATQRIRAIAAESDKERDSLGNVAEDLLARATSLLDEAADKLFEARKSGAGLVTKDALERRQALMQQLSEQSDALDRLNDSRWNLEDLDVRLDNAAPDVKARATPLMQQYEEQSDDLLENSDTMAPDELAAKQAAIEALHAHLEGMLPLDQGEATALDKKIELASAQYADTQKALRELDAMPDFKLLSEWLELQAASTEVTRHVVKDL